MADTRLSFSARVYAIRAGKGETRFWCREASGRFLSRSPCELYFRDCRCGSILKGARARLEPPRDGVLVLVALDDDIQVACQDMAELIKSVSKHDEAVIEQAVPTTRDGTK